MDADSPIGWRVDAKCRGEDPEKLFVPVGKQDKAKRFCVGCPVITECLVEALNNRIEWGIWGGWTETERRELLAQYPNVTDWTEAFPKPEPRPMAKPRRGLLSLFKIDPGCVTA